MKITLRNIKGISSLEFEVPDQGVWIITGLNGSGKTSLFAGLYRLRFNNAFQKYFRTGTHESKVDRYENAEVEYVINGNSVKYRYGGQRWRATPRRHANLLSRCQYPSVVYIEANADRVEPYADEIIGRNIRVCPASVRDFLRDVLADQKWNDLRFVNTRRGGGDSVRAYLIPYQNTGRTYYYSEKSFSLGELCVLRLATKMLNVDDNSLVLIDEVEMALHPQAQVRLLSKVKDIAQQKNLTVLFSTHSSTLIKNCHRNNLVYLQQRGGSVIVEKKPFPALILGEIAFDDELSTDFLFYVEDSEAKSLLEQMILRYMAGCNITPQSQPKYKVVPIGGYPQVISFLSSTTRLFPPYVKKYIFLDADARQSVRDALRTAQQPFTTNHNAVAQFVNYLPWTPELGVTQFIEQAVQTPRTLRMIAEAFPGANVNFGQIVNSQVYVQFIGANPRDIAKSRMRHLVQEVAAIANMDEHHVKRSFYGKLVEHTYANGLGALRALLGPIFNAR